MPQSHRPRSRSRNRRLVIHSIQACSRPALVATLCSTLVLAPGFFASADSRLPSVGNAASIRNINWRSDLPLADPVVHAPASLQANRTHTWSEGDTRFLFLEGDVKIILGAYGFQADRAVVRIDPDHKPGRTTQHLSIYLDQARAIKGQGPVWAQSPRLLVTVATTGSIELATDLLKPQSAADDALVVEAGLRMQKHLLALASSTRSVPQGPAVDHAAVQALRRDRHQQIDQDQQARLAQIIPPAATQPIASVTPPAPVNVPAQIPVEVAAGTQPAPVDSQQEIMPAQGLLGFNADKIVFEKADNGESVVALIGNVRVLYKSDDGSRNLTVQAQNAVLFVTGGDLESLSQRKAQATQVTGLYLEDNVVLSDGDYTVRAPRMFYDLRKNRAALLEAVLYTWDVQRQVPLYMRAQQLRQESRTSWSASDAVLTTSEFAQPHFAIGASKLTLAQVDPEGKGPKSYAFEAQDATLQSNGVPFFYWPLLAGDAQKSPLQRIGFGYSNVNGISVTTRWDLFALTGRQRPDNVSLTGNFDVRGDHGPAQGLNLDYKLPDMFGRFDSYLIDYDMGRDRIGGRQDIDHHGDQRGFMHWQHRQYLRENWELSLEMGYASDATFLEQFFRGEAENAKPYETSAYLKKQEDDWALTGLIKGDLQDFTTQTPVLLSPGYNVDKLPELGYYRVGTSLWDDRLTYFSENRLSRMRIRVGEDRPATRGFDALQSNELFGTSEDVHFDQALAAAGITTNYRMRLDSRHEINAPLKLGDVDLVPYIAGRFTGYDDNFSEFSGEQDSTRLMGTVGTRAHTQFSRTDSSVDWPFLDVHQLRHIIEPSVNVFQILSTARPEDFPVYDTDVEGIHQGFGVRAGLRNTLQTQRGGPGRWRNVDWLVVDTDIIHRSDDAPVEDRLARFYDYRPEYSIGGNHFYGHMLWAITDSLSAASELTYSFDHSRVAQYRVGLSFQHNPNLRSSISYMEVQDLETRLLSYGLVYQFTRTYALGIDYTYDIDRNESRSINASLERKIPGWRLVFLGSFDVVNDEQTVGFQLVPEGDRSSALLTPTGPIPVE